MITMKIKGDWEEVRMRLVAIVRVEIKQDSQKQQEPQICLSQKDQQVLLGKYPGE